MSSGDSIVDSVVQKFLQRSALGKQKYGVTLDRTDLSVKDWIQHTQEELMDAILYLEKLKQTQATQATQAEKTQQKIEYNGLPEYF
uniref:Uncharacterized protein n=1 Tax=viral metagenome TaxID=1070528 RepID=A0A6C0AP29_9ZZZZ